MSLEPTSSLYRALSEAYGFFNDQLFQGALPRCLFTLQRKNKTYGYFAGGRFGVRADVQGTAQAPGQVHDEIALNPSHFHERTVAQTLATLAHEMVHLAQHHQGKPSRTGYHNGEWARMMKAIGLQPTDTGLPGGKETGQRVTHYVVQGGRFDVACRELLASGYVLPYVELWSDGTAKAKKRASKTRYCCPSCDINVWGKPGLTIVCEDCDMRLRAEEPEAKGLAEAA